MKEVDKICELLTSLPYSDYKIGIKLFKERNFIELQYLVDSAIIKIRHNLSLESPKQEYIKISVPQLENLSIKISLYREQLVENVIQEDFIPDDRGFIMGLDDDNWEDD